jgi:hypothetical protein
MLLAYSPEGGWTPPSEPSLAAARGALVASHELEPVSTATSVRVFELETVVTDGPFAETRERLAGCHVVEADSLDEAIEIAARIPQARHGVVEIRPVAGREAAA